MLARVIAVGMCKFGGTIGEIVAITLLEHPATTSPARHLGVEIYSFVLGSVGRRVVAHDDFPDQPSDSPSTLVALFDLWIVILVSPLLT